MDNGVRTPFPSAIGLIPISDRRIVSELLVVWLTNHGIELNTVFHTARVQDFFTVNALTSGLVVDSGGRGADGTGRTHWHLAIRSLDDESCTSLIQTS